MSYTQAKLNTSNNCELVLEVDKKSGKSSFSFVHRNARDYKIYHEFFLSNAYVIC